MLTTEKVTLTIPADLMATVRMMAPARGQSQFITEAIRRYITEREQQALRERLIAGYQANAEFDATIATEWEPVEAESWLVHVPAQTDAG